MAAPKKLLIDRLVTAPAVAGGQLRRDDKPVMILLRLARSGLVAVEAVDALLGVLAALELVDDRAADYSSLDVLSLVADNSWNGGIVLSEFATKWPDLEPVAGRATKDGADIGVGHGRDILGHPFNSVAWLATQLNSRGAGGLKAGQVVMTGAVMKTVFPDADASFRFAFEGLGAVEVQVR